MNSSLYDVIGTVTMPRMVRIRQKFDTHEITDLEEAVRRELLKPDIISGILKGSQELAAGKLSGVEPPWPMPCKKYVCEAAAFLYE